MVISGILARVSIIYASRSCVFIKVVSKVVLRHKRLSTTRRLIFPVIETVYLY